jgi:NIPSNAP
VNEKLYLHEFIDIIGHGRAQYMYHMTANFSPMGQEDRNQLCYGVWGVLGSTGRWPEVVNIWELEGIDGAVDYFRYELNSPTLQDPRMAKWWSAAAPLRSGGNDRLMVPAPWTRTIGELCADGVRGELYAHDRLLVRPGTSPDYLEMLREQGMAIHARYGWELAGAWESLMVDDSECFVLWAIPRWEAWAEYEKARRADPELAGWWKAARDVVTSTSRIILIDSPLCPFKIGRQPRRSDRTEPWDEG